MKTSLLRTLLTAGALAWASCQTSQAGWLKRYIYNNYPGVLVTNLYTTNLFGAAAFPDFPDSMEQVPALPYFSTYLMETTTNIGDNYGSYLPGTIEPPETGNYVFWCYGDDETQLWMTTDPADPLNAAKKQLLCSVSGATTVRQWNKYLEQQSLPVYLEKGKRYYLELLQKEGGGNDWAGLGWQLPSGKIEQPMQTFYFQAKQNPADAGLVYGPWAGAVSPKNEFDLNIYDGMEAMLFADLNLTPPNTVVWRKNGTIIPGATQTYYRFQARDTDNGALFTVQVDGITYGPLTLTVLDDAEAPTLVSAGSQGNPTEVRVVYSEALLPATATNLANYALNSGTIQGATLQPDGKTVVLKTTLLTPTQTYTLTINNVQDIALPANTIAANTQTNFVITDGAISFRVYNTTFATDLATLRTATTNSATANATYTNNLFSEERIITTTTYPWSLVPLRDNYVGQMIGYFTAPETGNYKFGIASDDHSILYLGTTDQRSSKREICNYNGSTSQWNLNAQANQRSADIALVAGTRYYIEAVYRDGGGGEGVTVAYYTPSMLAAAAPWPPANNAAAVTPHLIPAQQLSLFTTFGVVTLKTNLPATFSAAESSRPTLQVTADGSPAYFYQWFKSGAPIVGATTRSYTLPFVRPADNAATFQVVVSNSFSSVTSVLATLTVTTDSAKPTVASVGSLYKGVVEVRLSEPITPATATALGNYSLLDSVGTPVAISSAVQDPNDATHVTLQTAAMPETDLMKLAIQNLADLSAAANVINAQTNAFRANNFDALERINNTQPYSASAAGEQILMTAGGADIYGTADQGAFLYKAVSGNFDYKIQGVSLQTINQWCKMGIMVRASTAANARNNFVCFTPLAPGQNTYSPQVRPSVGAASTSTDAAGNGPLYQNKQGGLADRPNVAYPSWLRLQRVGDIIYYHYSANGTNWTFWTWFDTATSPDGPLPASVQLGLALTSHDTARTVDGVMASFIAVNDGPLYFTLQPTNTTVVEGGTVRFYAAGGGTSPYFYQWLKNANPITDATNTTLTLTRVPFSDNGAQIACRVSNPYGQVVTSTNATLTVVKDAVLPTVRYYLVPKININPTEVKLLYSEPMDPTSAQNVANYAITTSPGGAPLAISSATLAADERTVTLTTAAQTAGTTYKVVVNNVFDLACCPANAVAANSTDYFFYAGSQPNFIQRADGYVIMEAENAQRFTASVSAGALEWRLQNIVASYSGIGYMNVTNVRATTGGFTAITGGLSQGTGAKMEFDVLFTRPATNYTIWIRGVAAPDGDPVGNNDSHYIGYDGNLVSVGGGANNAEFSQMTGWGSTTVWDWRSDSSGGADPMVITNVAPGLHTFVIWHREDGACVDKVILEPGVRTTAGNSTEPGAATSNGGLGDLETWDYIVLPPAGPTIAITSPTAGQTFPANASIPITATVGGPTPIVLVEFFAGTNLLGTATTEPYTITWPNVPEGLYSLTARVTDGLGYQATSAAVAITVDSTKPVAYAVGSLQGVGIGVYFSDLSGLDAVSANNPANYTVNGGAVTVTGALLEPDLRAVMLSLSAPISGAFSVAIKDVADLGAGPNGMLPVTLQSTVVTWPVNQDVGTTNATPPPLFTDPIMPGFAQALGTDGFYVHAGGSDVWNAADGMHFVHRLLTGDFDVSVRVDGLRLADQWSKAGLMVREDLDGNSRNYFFAATATNGVNQLTTQWRVTKGAATVNTATVTPAPIPNAWLRVTRTNQLLSFFYATNGVNWVSRYTTNLTATPYPAAVYVGLGTSSHNNGATLANTTGAYYRNLAGLAPSLPPTMTIGLVGGQVVISWTSSSSVWQLKSTGDLVPANWQPVGTPPVVNGETYTVTLPATGDDQYFRLVRP